MILQMAGSTYVRRLVNFYSKIYYARFRERPNINYLLFGRFFKSLFQKHGEIKLAAAILVHFEQNGDRIIKEKFPILWIPKSFDQYMSYLKDDIGIDIDNDEELMCAIESRLKYLDLKI